MSTAALETPPASAPAASALAEQRVLLHGVSWATFERLLEELGERRATRLAYDNGTLEIMAPQFQHDSINRTLHDIVTGLVVALNLNSVPAGSLTCKRDDLLKGIEPDSCFYIQNVNAVLGKEAIDLSTDPAPDLMIEVDITHGSLDKLPICAALGVKEHWRWQGSRLEIRHLRDGRYVDATESIAFPGMPLTAEVPHWIRLVRERGTSAMLREINERVRRQRPPEARA